MIISKSRVQNKASASKRDAEKKDYGISLDSFLRSRDYQGALTLLQFQQLVSGNTPRQQEWTAYCHFHYGEHAKALEIYQELIQAPDADPLYHTYGAACYYYMGDYAMAKESALKGPKCPLQIRIMFHSAHKEGDENLLLEYHQKLGDTIEDQLSLATVHYLRSHYLEATDIYKRLLLEHREYMALNVYVSLCYSKLDYYDVSQEIVQVYLSRHPMSPLALNLKACNQFRLYSGKVAEQELCPKQDMHNQWQDNSLIKHNLVVFRDGQNAIQVLTPLLDVTPEARMNLVIFHLRKNNVEEAWKLIKDQEPSTSPEYIIFAVVHVYMAQQQIQESEIPVTEHITKAQQFYQLVGASASECDTIPGRQCMSIQQYFTSDDGFLWNFGMAKAQVGKYAEGEDHLSQIKNEDLRKSQAYVLWLAKCQINRGKPRHAWDLYLRMDATDDAYNLVYLIANECYRTGQFYFAAKAFDVLERLDPNPDYWTGKKGACIGAFQMVVAEREPKDHIRDIISLLQNSSNDEVHDICQIIQSWAATNKVLV